MDAISEAILSFWDKEDEMHIWLWNVNPFRRYESMVEFLGAKAWYDGRGSFELVPPTEEELRQFKSPIDDMDFGGWTDLEDDGEFDLPF